jgi:hypothetical protein
MDKQKMIDVYKRYKIEMPLKAKYKKFDSRIYFAGDYKDGEEIEFFWNCENPSSNAIGNAFYTNKEKNVKLINIRELIF